MKAVIYARYSSDNQREESIEGQIRECMEFAERNDITVFGTYIDRALSAKTDVPCLSMSVLRDEGREQLLSACTEMLSHRVSTARYRIPMAESRIIAIMHRDGKVISTEYEGNDALVEAILPREFAARLEAYRC